MEMQSSSLPNRQNWQNIFAFLVWAVLFSLAYTQSPLFTSNQNQYFLHGLASAGFGNLSSDWLVNTHDPTPFFSGMVTLLYRLLPWSPIFYFFYAILMGLYLWSLYTIARLVFPSPRPVVFRTLFLAGIIVLHSAGWRFLISRTLGVDWAYIIEDGLAGQRMLGPVFQPSAFGVLLLVSVAVFLNNRSILAILTAVLAATFHPTYLFSAGILTGVYLLMLWRRDRNLRQALLMGGMAIILVLPTVWGTWQVFVNAPPNLAAQAREILVNYRIPHHALISEWWGPIAWIKVGLIILAMMITWRTGLFPILFFGFLFASTLTMIQVFSNNLSLALLFPWRISILLVPLSTTVLLSVATQWLLAQSWTTSARVEKLLRFAAYAFTASAVLIGMIRFALDTQRKQLDPERGIETFVETVLVPSDVFLTPIKMQDFRLETGAPVFVDFKSIPYYPDDVIEWYQRVKAAEKFYQSGNCTQLEYIQNTYNLTHLVWPSDQANLECPLLDQIYSDEAYQLYRFEPREE